jgi:hypothetical protein
MQDCDNLFNLLVFSPTALKALRCSTCRNGKRRFVITKLGLRRFSREFGVVLR